jgi:hypothetical protein
LKKNVILIPLLLVFGLVLSSCEGELKNSFTFRNLSMGKLYINFRATIHEVPVGETLIVKDVPKGTYTFSTTYEVPQNAVSSSALGDASGSVIFKQNTRAFILYSSTITEEGAYTLFATLTTSEDLTVDEEPTGP